MKCKIRLQKCKFRFFPHRPKCKFRFFPTGQYSVLSIKLAHSIIPQFALDRMKTTIHIYIGMTWKWKLNTFETWNAIQYYYFRSFTDTSSSFASPHISNLFVTIEINFCSSHFILSDLFKNSLTVRYVYNADAL